MWSNLLLSNAAPGAFNMYTVSRDLRTFSAAHRLNKGYEGKCKYLHGHSYNVTVALTAPILDQYDFVIDFGDIKEMFDNWVQEHWDHVTLVSELDTTLIDFLKIEKQDYFVIPGQRNTTAEALAEFLFLKFKDILAQNDKHTNQLKLISVKLSESEFSHAEYCEG
jgi:6-pyruvoyltetrahydropterin/6-carboxytetrahydropterin synthase